MNGAVRTRPWTRICRNSRQVPPTGSRTPRVSLPGAVAWPVIRAAPEQARAVRRAGRAHVGVEVIQRPGVEEDGVRKGAEPGTEMTGAPLRVGHVDVDEGGLDRVQGRVSLDVEAVAIHHLVGAEGRQRPRAVGAGHVDAAKQLEVGLAAGEVWVDVHQHPVGAGGGKGHPLVSAARSELIGGWSWMM